MRVGYLGEVMSPECNICGNREFADVKSRAMARCTNCGSVERTRLLWLYVQDMDFRNAPRILHLAPEEGLYGRLKALTTPGHYVCADFDPKRYRSFAKDIVAIDLTDLDRQPSDVYDLIVHSHVMEHIPCNIAYTLFHLHRMLKAGGQQLCVIPFLPGKYDECFQDISIEERVRRFGQHNHVRRFGTDDIDRHLGAIVTLPGEFDAVARFGEERLRQANIPEQAWRGFTVHTVLQLHKNDFKLRTGAAPADHGKPIPASLASAVRTTHLRGRR